MGTILVRSHGMKRTPDVSAPEIEIGIDADHRQAVADGLAGPVAVDRSGWKPKPRRSQLPV
jgi:hypothetical protein